LIEKSLSERAQEITCPFLILGFVILVPLVAVIGILPAELFGAGTGAILLTTASVIGISLRHRGVQVKNTKVAFNFSITGGCLILIGILGACIWNFDPFRWRFLGVGGLGGISLLIGFTIMLTVPSGETEAEELQV
jgi:hypothetical protein